MPAGGAGVWAILRSATAQRHTLRTGRQRDGSVDIKVRINREVNKKVNNNFRGKWTNAANKGVSEADIFEQ